ncbi:MAG: hypothetical protein IAE82_00615 [Opitutaceae bacterium]|nr:hypothetical protein [Opitutaceae bacterium]
MVALRCLGAVAGLVLLAAAPVHAGPTTTVAWENLQGTDTPPSAALLEADGLTPLSAGAAASGDGAIIALGYFTGATTSATFAGEWVPLTGPQAANIAYQHTSVGDTADSAGTASGFFTLQTDFDAGNSAIYQRIPAPGTRLAIAIYNRSTIGTSTHFNVVTHDEWQWRDPDAILPTFLFLNPTTPGAQWLGGPDTALRTALPTSAFPGDAARAPARLVNISTRGFVGTDAAQMIPGFVLEGSGSTRLLIRAVGPSLARFGIAGPLADPHLRVVRRSDGAVIAVNDDWHAQPDWADVQAAFTETGAFKLPDPTVTPTADAAVLLDLPVSPGGYTVTIEGKDGGTGVAIAEAYLLDDTPDLPTQLVNISTRGFVGSGESIMIPGFVVGPGGPRRLLIRAVGPTLGSRFSVPGTISDPRLKVNLVVPVGDPEVVLGTNEDWSDGGQAAAIAAAGAQVNAFGLLAGSMDAALILNLPASTQNRGITVQVSGADGATGLAITEIYELP